MFTATRIALAAVLIAGLSSAAMAQTIERAGNPLTVGANATVESPMLTLVAAHTSSRRAHAGVRQSRNARLNTYAPAQDSPPVSVVGPDNYKYWREACCF